MVMMLLSDQQSRKTQLREVRTKVWISSNHQALIPSRLSMLVAEVLKSPLRTVLATRSPELSVL